MISVSLVQPGVALSPGFLVYIGIISTGAIFGLAKYSKFPKPFKMLTQMLYLVAMAGIASKVIQNYLPTNFPVFHILQILQLLYFGLIFYYFFQSQPISQKIILYFSLLLFFISFFYSITQELLVFPSIGAIILSFHVIILSLSLLLKMIRSPIPTPILAQGKFWFAASSLFFYSITFFILGFYEVIQTKQGKMPEWTHQLLSGANYLLYTGYLITIFIAARSDQAYNE